MSPQRSPTELSSSVHPGSTDAVELLGASYAGRGLSLVSLHWRSIAAIAVAGFAVGATASLLVNPRFRADARLASPPAQGRPQLAALGSLASTFGISLGSGEYSAEFLAASLRARDVLDSMLLLPMSAFGSSATKPNLALYLGDADSLTGRRFEAARRTLQQRLSTDLDYRSGIVSVAYWDTDPVVAATLLDTLITRVNGQLIRFQRRYAAARRDYLEERVAAAQEDLSARERESVSFQQRNRIVNSPALQLEADRLARRVDMALGVVQGLQRQLDEAELMVRSDIPQVMLVESPVVPVRKFFPPRKAFALLGAVFPVSLWILILAWRSRQYAGMDGPSGSAATAS